MPRFPWPRPNGQFRESLLAHAATATDFGSEHRVTAVLDRGLRRATLAPHAGWECVALPDMPSAGPGRGCAAPAEGRTRSERRGSAERSAETARARAAGRAH